MKKIFTLLFIGFFIFSCEFDEGFEEMNVNPAKANQIEVGNKLTWTMLQTSGGRFENWRNSLILNSVLIQHNATTPSYWVGDKYYPIAGYANPYYTSLWDRNYPTAVKGIEDIIQQLTDEGNTGSEMGIARIFRVFIYSRITDTHGDIPYSEAGQGYSNGILKPKYDAQQDIYMDMLKELEEAAAQLGSSSSFGASDAIFGGDTAKWKAWANSLMLRHAMRLTKVDIATAQAWAVKAISAGTMTSNDHIAAVKHTDGPEGINKNGHGEVFDADRQARASATMMAHLSGDPRKSVMFQRRSDGSQAVADLIGMPNGRTSSGYTDLSGNAVPGISDTSIYAEPADALRRKDVPMVFQTYAEVEFLKAEAAIRGWISADPKAHYEAGVTAAMKMLKQIYPGTTAIPQADIDAYLSGPGAYDASKGWEMCMNEYWKATYLNHHEAWFNWRRTGYPTLTPTKHPSGVTGGKIMRRMFYPNSEASTNADNYAAAVARQGADDVMTRVWWDK